MALWQDIRFAVRLLVKDRWFTLGVRPLYQNLQTHA